MTQSLLRELPAVEKLLQQPLAENLVQHYGRPLVLEHIRLVLQQLRHDIISSQLLSIPSAQQLLKQIQQQINQLQKPSLIPVLNLTGTILHTNLGRAKLPLSVAEKMLIAATHNVNIEYQLETGKRGERDDHIEALLCQLTGAEAATVVNNNAAAVLLTLNSLSLGKEVPVSRGELVEIGGSFRIPDIMSRSGCSLVEIGTTNRTHMKDYENAINDNTALLLKVHTSNYAVTGFTKVVTEAELSPLAKRKNIPLVSDLGSGSLIDIAQFGLPTEPTVTQSINSGVDVITFSGDKLLGGCQAGFIVGKKKYIDIIRKNPLKRALRLDKILITALAEVLRLYTNPSEAIAQLPTLQHFSRNQKLITAIANDVLDQLQPEQVKKYNINIAPCQSQIGSGALPADLLPSSALVLQPVPGENAEKLQQQLRLLNLPIIGRISQQKVWLDCRTLDNPEQLVTQLNSL